MIVVADADEQRAPLPRADDAPRLAGRDHRDGIGALELGDGALHGREQVAAGLAMPVRVDEMGDDLGVGLRVEHVAARLELPAQLLEVLDDAVVDDGDFTA